MKQGMRSQHQEEHKEEEKVEATPMEVVNEVNGEESSHVPEQSQFIKKGFQ